MAALMNLFSAFITLLFSVRLLILTPFLPSFRSPLCNLLLIPPFFLSGSFIQVCSYFLASLLALRVTLSRSHTDIVLLSAFFVLLSILHRTFIPLISIFFIYPALHAPPLEQSVDLVPRTIRTASAFSLLSFNWVSPLVAKARVEPLQPDDIPPLISRMRTKFSSERFQPYYEKHRNLILALTKAFGPRFSLGGLFKILVDACEIASPLILRRILVFLETGNGKPGTGLTLSVIMFVIYMVQALTSQQYYDNTYTTQAQVRSALIEAVFSKTTRLSPGARAKYTSGQIQNLMSTDCRAVSSLPLYVHDTWSSLEQSIIALVLLVRLLGWRPLLVAFVVLAACIPVEAMLVRRQTTLREEALKRTDERVKHVSEALGAVKLVKLYAWEVPVMARVLKERRAELEKLKSIWFLESWNMTLVWGLYTILMVVIFGTYALIGNSPDASIVFPALALFDILFPALMFLPSLVNSLTHTLTSLKRLREYLEAEEIVPVPETQFAIDQQVLENEELDLAADNATFAWDPSAGGAPVLSSVSVKVPVGSLVCVIGGTGSGKSSFLAALIGEVPPVAGKVGIRTGRTISFCEQVPFICNASLRDNILFGKPYSEETYRRTISACSLLSDLETFPAGDMTEIGERGVNLSGGQRARVALARAVYSKSDICVLDDPLSAVDTFVGKALFKDCITGELRGRTCIWATNQLEFAALPEVDMVVVLRDGAVIEVGKRATLVGNPNSEFCKLLKAGEMDHSSENENDTRRIGISGRLGAHQETLSPTSIKLYKDQTIGESSELLAERTSPDYGSMEAGRLTRKESKDVGNVKVEHYMTYLAAFGSSATICAVLLRSMGNVCDTAATVWLGVWSDQDSPNVLFNFVVFLSIGVLSVIVHPISDFAVVRGALTASSVLHRRLLVSIFGAPMSFFYSTPQGRVVNRFSSDMDALDSDLVFSVRDLLYLVTRSACSVALILWALPPLIIAFLVVVYLSYVVQEYYRKSVLDVRRLQSLAYSPLYAHFSETLGGIPTLRAYKALPRTLYTNSLHADRLAATVYASSYVRRWLNIRMNTLGALLIFAATALAVSRFAGNLQPGMRGLVLSYTISIFSLLRYSVKMFTQAETQFNSVERVAEYSNEKFPQEERGTLKERLHVYEEEQERRKTVTVFAGTESNEQSVPIALNNEATKVTRWPQHGRIDFIDVEMRYRSDLSPALKDVSFTVQPGERIGIVGRTGAGKSSAIQCLFRLHEINEGQILIDGQNIRDIPLQELRSSLGVIPQEAVCFSGTIRSNLDMSGEYGDDKVLRALELCGLQESMTGKVSLDYEISENGSNLSVGQRQLLCLGRALLKGSKVLVLDEATSSVSQETDERVQRTLREEMRNCTVVTVAHRLQTVMGSDRIIVMDKGKIAEMGRPRDLLRKKSLLNDLVSETGELTATRLRGLAFDAQDNGDY